MYTASGSLPAAIRRVSCPCEGSGFADRASPVHRTVRRIVPVPAKQTGQTPPRRSFAEQPVHRVLIRFSGLREFIKDRDHATIDSIRTTPNEARSIRKLGS